MNLVTLHSLTPPTLQQLVADNPDGFTVKGTDFTAINETGYAVGGVIPTLRVSNEDYYTVDAEEFFDSFAALQQTLGDRLFLGGWVKDGIVHVDAVLISPNEHGARRLGKALNQDAIAKLTDGEYIYTLARRSDEWLFIP